MPIDEWPRRKRRGHKSVDAENIRCGRAYQKQVGYNQCHGFSIRYLDRSNLA